MSSWLIFFKFLTLFIPSLLYQKLLEKYGDYESYSKYAIFVSNDFSVDEDMYFTLTISCECDEDLKYEYFDSIEEAYEKINIKYIPEFSVSSKTSYEESSGSYSVMKYYFTIKKKSNEFNNTNGKYLLLYYNFESSSIRFSNNKSDEGKKIKIYKIIYPIVLCIVAIIIIIVCICQCKDKNSSSSSSSSSKSSSDSTKKEKVTITKTTYQLTVIEIK